MNLPLRPRLQPVMVPKWVGGAHGSGADIDLLLQAGVPGLRVETTV